jgi:hypothetical protein
MKRERETGVIDGTEGNTKEERGIDGGFVMH